jgi:hypothetical protein
MSVSAKTKIELLSPPAADHHDHNRGASARDNARIRARSLLPDAFIISIARLDGAPAAPVGGRRTT